jgi:hypothetical protein
MDGWSQRHVTHHGRHHGCCLTGSQGDEIVAAVEVKSKPVCTGMATGHLMVKAQGGTPPYIYKWSQGGINSEELTRLVPGLYQ